MLLTLALVLLVPQELLATPQTAPPLENLGADVGVLGDVDGDGRDDFLVATGSKSGPSEVLVVSGRTSAILQRITPPGQVPRSSPFLSSNQLTVAGAGDVDGDGYLDYLVGNQNEAVAGAPDVGSVRVYSSRDGRLIHQLFGSASGDFFGASIDGGIDVDEDGLDDFLVGAPGDGLSGLAGRAQLFSGVDATVIFSHVGSVANAQLGRSVTLLADADGDLTPDYAVGAPGASPAASGRVDLFSGRTGSLIRGFAGYQVNDGFGTSIDDMGDLDGDGLTDLLVGIPGSVSLSGVQVLSSGTGQVLLDLTKSNAGIAGLGEQVVALGDADGDGVPDFAASGAGRKAGAWSGGSGAQIGSFTDVSNTQTEDRRSLAGGLDVDMDGLGDLLTGVTGYSSSARAFGFSLSPDVHYGEQGGYGSGIAVLGDVDGDGCDDYAVGEPGDLTGVPPGSGLGRVQIISGRDGSVIREQLGTSQARPIGFTLVALDDLDGDGVLELATSTFGSPLGERVIVFSPLSGQVIHDISLGFGGTPFSLASGGDADGDGVSDLLVGFPYGSLSGSQPAKVLVFSGATGAPLPGVTASTPNALLGFALAWVGDVNGDGRDDWATTELFFVSDDDFPLPAVKVFSGLDGTLLRTFSDPGSQGTFMVGAVADLDQDGLPDLLMSSKDSAAGEYQGSAYILSSATGEVLRTHRGTYTNSKGQLMSSFGGLAGVGDMDSDGIDDYAIGALELGEPRRVYVFSSATGELLMTHASPFIYNNFGWQLAGLDADGDGRDEILVAANYSGGPHGSATGAVYILRADNPSTVTYCPAVHSSSGCVPAVSTLGSASVSQASGFDVRVSGVEGARSGYLFWGHGTSHLPFTGSASTSCVGGPIVRLGSMDTGGVAGECKGLLKLDFNTWMREHPRQAPAPGSAVYLQAWIRDPQGPTGSSFSDAVSFWVVR